MDQDGSGQLSKQEFVQALTCMELGLTRREINAIMFRVDQDNDGNVSYGEFVPFAFDLLQKLTSMRLLETELENDELGQYLHDLFKAKDTEMLGALHVDDVRDVLHLYTPCGRPYQVHAFVREVHCAGVRRRQP